MQQLSVEVYNKTQHKDYFELTAYFKRDDAELVRVDIYPKIQDKIHTTYEAFLIDEEANDIPTNISEDEWDGISCEVNRVFNIKI